jgi:hypothetical protein
MPSRRPMRIGPMDGYVLMSQPETATPSNLGSQCHSFRRQSVAQVAHDPIELGVTAPYGAA